MKSEIERMFRSVGWANREVLAALRANPAAQAETLLLISHILAVEHVWLHRLQHQEPARPVWPTMTLLECDAFAIENADGYAAYLGGLSEGDLGSSIAFRNSQGEEFTTRAVDILIHVVTHGSYHRGQIAPLIGRTGGQGVNTDFINFARLVEPIATPHP